MKINSQHEFIEKELDTRLLLTPYRYQTNWHVITGASCSGKTTLINLIENNGFKTIPEVARQYFEGELARGHKLEAIRSDRAALTIQIYHRWAKSLSEFCPDEFLFFDRGLPDAFAFFRYAGMDPNEILLDCLNYRYASVFMLDRLPYLKDGVRAGDDQYAEYLDEWIYCDYRSLGYEVVRVPVLPPEERLALVLTSLYEQGFLKKPDG
ncbi:MAG: AAA family ATPase [Anaerolineales bacterium]